MKHIDKYQLKQANERISKQLDGLILAIKNAEMIHKTTVDRTWNVLERLTAMKQVNDIYLAPNSFLDQNINRPVEKEEQKYTPRYIQVKSKHRGISVIENALFETKKGRETKDSYSSGEPKYLDGSRGYHIYRENDGKFGSYPSHDNHYEEGWP
jgi:hypothetical protein